MGKLQKLFIGFTSIGCATVPFVTTSCGCGGDPIQTTNIFWKDGWYAYSKQGTAGAARSNKVDVEFELSNNLQNDQTLEFELAEIDGSANYSIQVNSSSPVIEDKVVKININLKSTASSLYVGEYRTYKVIFNCKNANGSTVWTQTINDCFLCMLTDMNSPTLAREAYASGYQADLETTTSINFDTSTFNDALTFDAKFETIGRSTGIPSNVEVVKLPGQSSSFKSERKLYQKIQWNQNPEELGLSSGACLTYNTTFTLSLKKYPSKKYTKTFTNLLFTYLK